MPPATQDSPVTMIEGIGPAAAARLGEMAVVHVFDLLRASPEDLHAAVADVASLDEVRGWRAMAAFLQVEGMTNQWAEALARTGFDSIEELDRSDAAALTSAFASAVANGWLAEVPDAAALAELRIDAARLARSGAVNVTVQDESGAPIPGAEVRIGSSRATTNGAGRARLVRIPLRAPAVMTVSKDGFATRTLEVGALLLDEFQLGVEVVRLAAAPAGAAPGRRLREYDGDLLPELSMHSMTTEARGEDALRDRDVLVLRRFYQDGTTAQLTSKFLEYEDGRFVAVSFRVARDRLPSDAVEREHFLYRRGAFDRIAMNATRLDLFKAMRRARAAVRSGPPPETIAEREARMRSYGERLVLERRWSPGGSA